MSRHEHEDAERPRGGSPRRGDTQYRVPETEAILRRVVDIIDSSPGMPMSASVRVNKEEVLELLDDAVSRLPDELRSARWLLKEREEFLARSRRDGEELIADAKSRVAHMVQRTEVVRAAESRARQVIETAESDSRRLKLETEDFLDQRLASFEILLDKLGKTVGAGRQKLSIGNASEALSMDEIEDVDDPTKGFFDQDR